MGFWENCFAQVAIEGGKTDFIATIDCIPNLIGQLYTIALSLAGVVALFFVVWGGIKLIRSGGDPKQLENARHTIMYAIIGMIIVLMAYFIVYTISRFTGVDCITVFGFNQCMSEEQRNAMGGSEPVCRIDVNIPDHTTCNCPVEAPWVDDDGDGAGVCVSSQEPPS